MRVGSMLHAAQITRLSFRYTNTTQWALLPSEGVETCSLRHVPDANAPVLGVAEDQLLTRVEENAGDIGVVASAGVHLPGLGVVESPQLHLSIICSGDHERDRWMERCPVDPTFVTVEEVPDHGIGCA